MPPEARPDGTVVACGNRVYVLGGLCIGGPFCPDQIFDSIHYNNCVFYFDCVRLGCGWKRAPPMLVPRQVPRLLPSEKRFTPSGQLLLREVVLPRFSIYIKTVGICCRPLPLLLLIFYTYLALFSSILPDLEFWCTSVPTILFTPSAPPLMVDHGNAWILNFGPGLMHP
ncbi:hypothetical protein V6N11_048450 [Hibiscus sabdariffa]|uniref:Uncharacterized protein n=1 Tax=Hibiscus sabdariffa TaxID=183260 RepID=A0ABR2PVA5_9ROSI